MKENIMNKSLLFMIVAYVFLTGCSTVDGMRTDVARGVNKVAELIKPCDRDDDTLECKENK
jgi:predicted small secreted protein